MLAIRRERCVFFKYILLKNNFQLNETKEHKIVHETLKFVLTGPSSYILSCLCDAFQYLNNFDFKIYCYEK